MSDRSWACLDCSYAIKTKLLHVSRSVRRLDIVSVTSSSGFWRARCEARRGPSLGGLWHNGTAPICQSKQGVGIHSAGGCLLICHREICVCVEVCEHVNCLERSMHHLWLINHHVFSVWALRLPWSYLKCSCFVKWRCCLLVIVFNDLSWLLHHNTSRHVSVVSDFPHARVHLSLTVIAFHQTMTGTWIWVLTTLDVTFMRWWVIWHKVDAAVSQRCSLSSFISL